jgi:hypothetical protein
MVAPVPSSRPLPSVFGPGTRQPYGGDLGLPVIFNRNPSLLTSPRSGMSQDKPLQSSFLTPQVLQFPEPEQPPPIPHQKSQEEIELNFLDGSEALPWLEPALIQERCQRLGLKQHAVAGFVEQAEFVSLGCFCGVTRALQCLGLKRYTYPFDWVRSNTPATICCLQTDFKHFTTHSFVGEGPGPGLQLYGGSKWGGSFWHHNPDDAKVQAGFQRRISRLYGKLEVPPERTRVFCISLNSLTDLASIPKLRMLLEEKLPKAEIYLLVFIDNQPAYGPIRLECEHDDHIIFYWIHQEMFDEMGRTWSEQKHAEAYADGLAAALRLWTGTMSTKDIPELDNYVELFEACNNFDGGNPAERLYWPLRGPLKNMPRFPRRSSRRRNPLNCSLPWPLDFMMSPCSTEMDEDDQDDAEVIIKQATPSLVYMVDDEVSVHSSVRSRQDV